MAKRKSPTQLATKVKKPPAARRINQTTKSKSGSARVQRGQNRGTASPETKVARGPARTSTSRRPPPRVIVIDDEPELEPIEPALRACVDTCVPLMTPELWFAGKRTPLHECVGTLASGAGYPPQAAAFVWASQQALEKVKPAAMLSFMARAAALQDQPALEQDRVVRAMATHTTSTLESVARDRVRPRPKGPPDLRGAWHELGNAMSSLSFGLRDLAGRQHGAGPSVETGSGAAIQWYGVSEDVVRLRVILQHVEPLLGQASVLPEQHLALDQRWQTRARLLIGEVRSQFGAVVDAAARAGSPAIVGSRLLHSSATNLLKWLEARMLRHGELAGAVDTFGSQVPSGDVAGEWVGASWVVGVVAKAGLGTRHAIEVRLARLAKKGAFGDGVSQTKPRGPRRYKIQKLLETPELNEWSHAIEKAFDTLQDKRSGRSEATSGAR